MKRLLDIVSAVLVVLAVALGWRLVQVLQVAPPVFGDAPQTAKVAPLPPPASSPTPRGAGLDAIVDGNLFETERGYREPESGDDAITEEPLPPPTNVVLNGVFFAMSGRPMAIMTDTNSGNRQLTLQTGDNLGDYQVGDITNQRVTLLGRGGQEFALELNIRKGGGGASVSRPSAGRAAAARAPARPAARPAARPTATRSPAAQRVTQTAAQRAAEARRQQAARARQQAAANTRRPQGQQAQKPDPTEQRLEALRRLREAARAR